MMRRHDEDGQPYIAYYRRDVITGFVWSGMMADPVQVTREMGEPIIDTFHLTGGGGPVSLAEFKRQCDTYLAPKCLNEGPDCAGVVEYQLPLSGTGRSFPRCDHHWDERLDQEQVTRERYPDHPPADWSPLDAGESWYED